MGVIAQAMLSLALVVVLFHNLQKDVDLPQMWAEIQAMTLDRGGHARGDPILDRTTYAPLSMSVTPGRDWPRDGDDPGGQRRDQHRADPRAAIGGVDDYSMAIRRWAWLVFILFAVLAAVLEIFPGTWFED